MTMPPEKVTVLVIVAVIAVLVSVTLLKSPERVDRDRQAVWEEDAFEQVEPPRRRGEVSGLRRGDHRTLLAPRPRPRSGARPAPTVEPARARSYRVRRGDSLGAIARRYYGKSSMWPAIAKANAGLDPKRLQPGQQIKIPSMEGRRVVAPARGAASPGSRAPAAGGWHTVAAGENLESIARRRLGKASAWRRIYDANRQAITDPAMIREGQRLRIPAGG